MCFCVTGMTVKKAPVLGGACSYAPPRAGALLFPYSLKFAFPSP
ncbi:hypothetical protein CLOSTASPAR_03801 [[Clostridium] asparagiforme DSM 15981]|uniref:Uncharacterized protein n=1 Tax=[Clostridium] asparagiforme DSM 15981 TaxID=518636 RepID=C0D3G0_9FIRM|nr:hypothetical protein CLOSTASPAR_03801 [[Clostridium] asparagiforme DSM 15981]